MLHIKASLTASAAGRKTILLRHQSHTAYDIHVVRYTLNDIGMMSTAEQVFAALSQRFEDQNEDAVAVGFEDMLSQQHIYAVFGWGADFNTSGGVGMILSNTLAFPKPYRVPYSAAIFNIATAVPATIGVEVWFDRLRISALEQAELVTAAGGRTETS